jgi:hypothetical protein
MFINELRYWLLKFTHILDYYWKKLEKKHGRIR